MNNYVKYIQWANDFVFGNESTKTNKKRGELNSLERYIKHIFNSGLMTLVRHINLDFLRAHSVVVLS